MRAILPNTLAAPHTLLRAGAGAAGRPLPQLPRRVLRSGSASLQRIAAMVGKSRQIYKVRVCFYGPWRSMLRAPPRQLAGVRLIIT